MKGGKLESSHSEVVFLFGTSSNQAGEQATHTHCTAVRIAPDIIITAAHCVADTASQGSHRYYIDSKAKPLFEPKTTSVEQVRGFFVHPGYSLESEFDIAIGFLSSPNFAVNVATLPTIDDLEFTWDLPFYTVAYGVNSEGLFASTGSGIKRSGILTVAAASDMVIKMRSVDAIACSGDSGAPLFSQAAPNVLVGILSTGEKSFLGYCTKHTYWTRILAYRSWLEDVMQAACDVGLRPDAVCEPRLRTD